MRRDPTTSVPPSAPRFFTLGCVLALAAGLAAAVVVAPGAGWALAAAGFHLPFPRIFDRTVMVTLLGALILASHTLGFTDLIRRGFAAPRANLGRAALGLALGLGAITVLFTLAIVTRVAAQPLAPGDLAGRLARNLLPALAIGIIEEGFFRAFLLGGLLHDWSRRTALVASSIVYALAHLVRAPAHYYLAGFHPGAGLADLALSAAQLAHPLAAAPTLIGLTLLGLVLGQAFLATGNVYFSLGMHAGFVLGAKSWPAIARHAAPFPRWLAGQGPVPLIAAPAAWLIALVLLGLLPRILGARAGAPPAQADFLGG